MTISQQIQNLEKNLLNQFDKKFQESEKRLEKGLNKKFEASEKRLLTHIDQKLAEASKNLNDQLQFHERLILVNLEDKFDERQKELRNDNLNYKDEIIGEIVSLRQETTITASYRPKIADHENRISKLERRTPPSVS